jgi:hypothetical protein
VEKAACHKDILRTMNGFSLSIYLSLPRDIEVCFHT